MTVFDLFSEKSDIYASARPKYPRELFEFIAASAGGAARVWDCGAGSGQAAVGLADFFHEVYATDISEQQIAHHIPRANIHYSVQSAEHSGFPENFFDAVVVAQALHWFDFDRFWPEVKRVLKPNGLFAAWTYDWFFINPEIDALIQEQVLDVIKPFWSPRNQLAWGGYRTVDIPFPPIATPRIDLSFDWNLEQLLAYLHTWSAVRACIRERGGAFFEQAAQALADCWGEPSLPRAVRMDFYLRAGRNS